MSVGVTTGGLGSTIGGFSFSAAFFSLEAVTYFSVQPKTPSAPRVVLRFLRQTLSYAIG